MLLHYAQNSRAVRVAWLLEELNLKYKIKKYKLGNKEMREEIFRKINHINGWEKDYINNLLYDSLSSQSKYFINSGLYWRYIKIFLSNDFKLAAKNLIAAILDYCTHIDISKNI